jgi:hypothetical protein
MKRGLKGYIAYPSAIPEASGLDEKRIEKLS